MNRNLATTHSPSRFFRNLWLLPGLMILVSMACTLPSLSRATQAPTQNPAQPTVGTAATQSAVEIQPSQATPSAARPAIPLEKLPPAVVEVNPQPRSDLAPTAQPVFYFNQPMERASVEAAFKADPDVRGRFEWLDDATLRFVPDQPLAAQTHLSLTINVNARSAKGLNLTQPVQVDYQTAGPLRLVERLPAPNAVEVNPSSAVVLTFNQPVVALGADPSSLQAAFTLDPQAQGRAEWLNTSTYIFYPQPALEGGTAYTVRVDPNLSSTQGTLLTSDTSSGWTFQTAAPKVLSFSPSSDGILELDAAFELTFNQPMDPTSVEPEMALLAPDASKVSGTFDWNETNTVLTFKPTNVLQRGVSYNLLLNGTAHSAGGASLGQNFTVTYNTIADFRVAKTNPAAGETITFYDGYASIQLEFTAPTASNQDLKALINISPSISDMNIYRDPAGYIVSVAGYFQPSISYTLSISRDLRDRWGATLGTDFSYPFKSQPARPGLVIPVRQAGETAVFVPHSEISIPAQATNITRLTLSRGRLDLGAFMQIAQDWQGLKDWESSVDSSWARLYYPQPNMAETIDIPLTQSGSLLAPGLYFLNTASIPATSEEAPAPLLLVVSPTQMVIKTSYGQAFVWAVREADNTPVTGSAVTIYNSFGQSEGDCITDLQGTCQVAVAKHTTDSYPVYFAVIGQPGGADFSLAMSNWNEGISPWEFGVSYDVKDARPQLYTYTDRPIYRPGQAVNFRVVARAQENGRYFAPPFSEVVVDVVSPYNPITSQTQVLTTLRLPLSIYGTAAGLFSLPDDARPGMYTLQIKEAGYQNVYFEVAEYRKPELDVQVKFSKEEALSSEDIQAQASVRYFFGAPAGNVPVQWRLFFRWDTLDVPGLTFGAMDLDNFSLWSMTSFGENYLMDGQGQTAPDGTLTLTFPSADLREKLGSNVRLMQQLVVEVTTMDESGLPVSGRGTMRLHPAAYYIGVHSEQWSVPAGQDLTYTIRTVDWKGQPVGDKPLTARFRKVNWVAVGDYNPQSPPVYQVDYHEMGSTDFRTSADGQARLVFTPSEPGTFQIEVAGQAGFGDEDIITQDMLWVSGAGGASWPSFANQRLLLRADAKKYKPGDTAHIFIPNSFGVGAQALVTVERSKVMRSQVVQIDEASFDLALPLGEDDAPNIYVSVTLLGKPGGRPDFRYGLIELAVDPAAQTLQVEVSTNPAQAQPGGQVSVTITVKDATGNPVQGEFSLALVDKAVLALVEPNSVPIREAFYSAQPLGVLSSLSLAAFAGREMYVPLGRGGGGGGGDALAQPVRTKFEDTAFWNGTIETDTNGIAQLTVTLPDNTTTWRADVRGLSEETQVGQAEVDLVTSKPLLVRPVTPRFVVLGDHLQLSALVHNNTQAAISASVELRAVGFAFDEPNSAVQPVDIPAGGRAQINWWGTVQDVPALDLTFSADGGGLSDATTPEAGPLPVLRYLSPQTFGTSGLLADPGERLEVVSLPRTYTPAGGELRLELSPSLTATVLEGLTALESYPHDFVEPILSRLLPNLAALQALKDFELEDAALRGSLEKAVTTNVNQIVLLQNEDGGWGWASGYTSDRYISSYVVLGLTRAAKAGVFVDPQVLEKGLSYLLAGLANPDTNTPGWQLDRLSFEYFVLYDAGQHGLNLTPLYDFRDKLSPWGKAFLALTLDGETPADPRARTIISDLQASASRSASGANWQDPSPNWHNWSTPNFTTAVVAYAIARLDPASQVLLDGVRYLVLNRRSTGAWNSSYETSWVLLALIETVKGTGDLQASYGYSATLNGAPLIEGQVDGPAQAVNTVTASVPLSNLVADQPNALQVQRGPGSGRLYYRAFLEIDRPADQAPVIQRGLSITRAYYAGGQDCRKQTCSPLNTIDLTNPQPVQVRLTLTVPEDSYYVVVEDTIPAGAEVLNPRLKTSQQTFIPEDQQMKTTPYSLEDPFAEGWGWWLFNDPQVFDEKVRWVVDYLPAGTYELTYRLTAYLPGEFRLIPAHAWQYYFPDVEGTSGGAIINIK